jgi:hypothetical protein
MKKTSFAIFPRLITIISIVSIVSPPFYYLCLQQTKPFAVETAQKEAQLYFFLKNGE